MKNLVLEIINEIIVGKGLPALTEIEVSMDSDLRSDFGLDSLDLAVLTVKIEDRTNVDVFENGIITTFGEIVELLENVK
jgi:acyl carrier protein